jgi:hypothetical protein
MEDTVPIEVFEKVAEEDRLYQELMKGSKAYDFVLSVRDFQDHVAFCLAQLREIIGVLRSSKDIGSVPNVLTRFRFFLFSFGAVHLSLENLLYQETDRLRLKEILHPVIDVWKKSVPVQLLKEYRNRTQHSRYPLPVLSIHATGPSHRLGPTWSADFRLSDTELAAITSDLPADLKARCETFLEDNVKAKPDGIFALLDAYKLALDDLLVQMRTMLRGTHSQHFENMRGLVERIDAVRAWLIAQGVQNPQQRMVDELMMPVRDW